MTSTYDGMTTSELLDIVRETWIEYDLKQVIDSAPPDDDYIGAHIIDCAVYATPATPADETVSLSNHELTALRQQLSTAQAENARWRAAMLQTGLLKKIISAKG